MQTSGREAGVRRRAAGKRRIWRARRRLGRWCRPWLGRKEERAMLIAALVLAAAAGVFLGAGPALLAKLLDGGEDPQAGRTAPEMAALFIRDRSGF